MSLLPPAGHVSLRPAFCAHGPSRLARRLRAGRRRAVHGTDDAAGVVVRLHDGGCDHAAVGHARQRQSQNQIRRAKGEGADMELFKNDSIAYAYRTWSGSKALIVAMKSGNLLILQPPLLQGTYTLARAQQSFRSLVHIHEKNGERGVTRV